MAVIFDSGVGKQSQAGQVVVLSPTIGAGSLLQVTDWGGFTSFKSIFTSVNLGEMTNHQFQHMLGNRIQLNAFGDRIGQVQLGGLSFFDNCADVGQQQQNGRQRAGRQNQIANARNHRVGISHVIDYYRRMKLTNRADPVKITLDPVTAYEGYLFRFQAGMLGDQHTNARMFQFSLSFATLPPEVAQQKQ